MVSQQSTALLQPQSDEKIIEETWLIFLKLQKARKITEVWEAIQIEGTSWHSWFIDIAPDS